MEINIKTYVELGSIMNGVMPYGEAIIKDKKIRTNTHQLSQIHTPGERFPLDFEYEYYEYFFQRDELNLKITLPNQTLYCHLSLAEKRAISKNV